MTTSLFVLWSGGADSTFLVEHSLADPAYDLVLAGYVHIQNNEAKAASELAAIERMLPLLRANPRFEYAGIIAQVNYPRTNPNLAYKQIPIWLHALVEAIHFPVDEVAIGYCGGDDAAQHIATIQTIYASYQPLMHRRLPPLRFPLAQYTKAEVPRASALHCGTKSSTANIRSPRQRGGMSPVNVAASASHGRRD